MQHTEFPPDLAFRIRVASALVGVSPARYVRDTMARVTSELASVNPFIRKVYESRS
jgi:hypothetical protein